MIKEVIYSSNVSCSVSYGDNKNKIINNDLKVFSREIRTYTEILNEGKQQKLSPVEFKQLLAKQKKSNKMAEAMFVEITNRIKQAKNDENISKLCMQDEKILNSIILDIEVMALWKCLMCVLYKYYLWGSSLIKEGEKEKIEKENQNCLNMITSISRDITYSISMQMKGISEGKRKLCVVCEEVEKFIENFSPRENSVTGNDKVDKKLNKANNLISQRSHF